LGGEGVGSFLCRLQDIARPAFLSEKAEEDLGIGGSGTSPYPLPCESRNSSVDDGAVDAALNLEELSAVDAVLVLEAPLPLHKVSQPSFNQVNSIWQSQVPHPGLQLTDSSQYVETCCPPPDVRFSGVRWVHEQP
jgi:hypothetical protein